LSKYQNMLLVCLIFSCQVDGCTVAIA